MIKDMCAYRTDGTVSMETLIKRVTARGMSHEALFETVKHYSEMNVLMQTSDGNLQIVNS